MDRNCTTQKTTAQTRLFSIYTTTPPSYDNECNTRKKPPLDLCCLLSGSEHVSLHTGHDRLNHSLFTNFGIGQSELCSCQTGSMTIIRTSAADMPASRQPRESVPTGGDSGEEAFRRPGRPAMRGILRAKNREFPSEDADRPTRFCYQHFVTCFVTIL